MARRFPWGEVAVGAAKGAAVMTAVVGGALWVALTDDPALPGLLLGCAAGSYALCFVLSAALQWYVQREYDRSGPPPTRFVGGWVRGLAAGFFILLALALCALWVAEAVRG